MSTENALAIPVSGNVSKYADDDAFKSLATASDFLPRLMLYGSSSNPCKEGKIGVGRYGLARGDNIEDLGPEVRVFALSWRPKAMRILGDKIETNFNPKHPEFKKIQAESGDKDTGSMCGVEFLVWLGEKGVFATFYMASKTMRREADKLVPFMAKDDVPAKPMTLKVTLIDKGKFKWHGPVVTGCSLEVPLPDPIALGNELVKFCNPPEPKEVSASAAEAAATSRAR